MYKNALEDKSKPLDLAGLNYDAASNTLQLSGEWSWASIDEKALLLVTANLKGQQLSIEGRKISYLDTTGAFFLRRMLNQLEAAGNKVKSINLIEVDVSLLAMTNGIQLNKDNPLNVTNKLGFVAELGTATVELCRTSLQLVAFFGHLCVAMVSLFKRGHSLYVQGIFETITTVGLGGILISSLLCFLIGVNLTYQMAPQFVTYGANVYVVNFLGIALLREVTPLLTAIIVAGRSGSAITASIGTMKVQEEIDALQTMGISPIRRLVLPRVIGLLICLPVLTMLADVASMLGGMLVSATSLDISYSLFLHRLQSYVSINNYVIGMVKTFAFAWIIAMVGCFCGFKVKGNADSIGTQTTRSVVMSICLIIFVDALFAIMFKNLGM